jgi:hypothetical protein
MINRFSSNGLGGRDTDVKEESDVSDPDELYVSVYMPCKDIPWVLSCVPQA